MDAAAAGASRQGKQGLSRAVCFVFSYIHPRGRSVSCRAATILQLGIALAPSSSLVRRSQPPVPFFFSEFELRETGDFEELSEARNIFYEGSVIGFPTRL